MEFGKKTHIYGSWKRWSEMTDAEQKEYRKQQIADYQINELDQKSWAIVNHLPPKIQRAFAKIQRHERIQHIREVKRTGKLADPEIELKAKRNRLKILDELYDEELRSGIQPRKSYFGE